MRADTPHLDKFSGGGGYDKSDFHAMMDDRWMEDDMELKIEHLQMHFEKKTVL